MDYLEKDREQKKVLQICNKIVQLMKSSACNRNVNRMTVVLGVSFQFHFPLVFFFRTFGPIEFDRSIC